MEIYYFYSIFFLVIFLFVAVYNFFLAPQISKSQTKNENEDLVSVLIPARNEEKNIAECINSILNQDYQNMEIIVVDDESEDNTAKIVNEISLENKKVKLIHGEKLPAGWLGKNWACHQLSQKSSSKFLLFIDADVRLHENAVTAAITKMKQKNLKALSVFPTQKIKTFGESLITPIMNWILLTFLPLKLVYSSSNKSFVAANGQFFLFETEFYKKIGGHESVKNEIVEDMAFARLIKSSGEKLMTALGGNLIRCRMYTNFREGFNGFSKNFYRGFKLSQLFFLLFLIFIESIFLLPVLLSFFFPVFILHAFLILSLQILILQTSRQNLFFALLHPIQMITLPLVGINSLLKTKAGTLKWKERIIR